MRSDIVLGSVFPDYELRDQTDTLRKVSELQGDDPLIRTFERSHYCPKEHQQHLSSPPSIRRSLWHTQRSSRFLRTTT